MKRILLISCLLTASLFSYAQQHVFETFKPLYFTGGIPLSEKPTAQNADLKFQLSFRLNMAKNIKDKGIDVFLGYTQLSEWNIFGVSSPFYDHMFIPGVYCSWDLRNKAGEDFGNLLFGAEHRSNGREDDYSRSLNHLLVTYSHYLPHNFTLQATLRGGFSYYGEGLTMALYNYYCGYLNLAANWTSTNRNWDIMLSVSPIWNKSIANVTAEVGWKIGRKGSGNPYLFVQYHYGYDEALRDCVYEGPQKYIEKKGANYVVYDNTASPINPRHMLRFGILFHPGNCWRATL